MKRFALAAALLVIAAAAPAAAVPAGPSGGLSAAAASIDTIETTAGGHRSCEWGPVRGWHRHLGWAAVPVPCAPLAAQPFRCRVDYFGVRHCRW